MYLGVLYSQIYFLYVLGKIKNQKSGDQKMKITKAAIQALATQSVKAQYARETDKALYLEEIIVLAGFDISLTDRPDQWDRCIEWLENAIAARWTAARYLV